MSQIRLKMNHSDITLIFIRKTSKMDLTTVRFPQKHASKDILSGRISINMTEPLHGQHGRHVQSSTPVGALRVDNAT